MKALPLPIKRLWPWLKFLSRGLNFKVKVITAKIMVRDERVLSQGMPK